MTATIIDGKKIAEEILQSLTSSREQLGDISLAAISIGTDDVTRFLAAKERAAKKLQIQFRHYELDPKLGRHDLRQRITKIVRSPITAVILQLPLPAGQVTQSLLNAIIPTKDADCLSTRNLGAFYAGAAKIIPPSVATVRAICAQQQLDVVGQRVLVVGYGQLVGRPVAHALATAGALVTIVPKPNEALDQLLTQADLVVSATGQPGLIQSCKVGATVIDFGSGRHDDHISGDVEVDMIKVKARFVTPTPGGTGPIVVAALMANVIELAKRQQQ